MEVQQLLRELVEAEKDEDEDRTAARERGRKGKYVCRTECQPRSLPASQALLLD